MAIRHNGASGHLVRLRCNTQFCSEYNLIQTQTQGHSLTGYTYTSTAHSRRCQYCSYNDSGTHTFIGSYTSDGSNGHYKKCVVCAYKQSYSHDFTYTSINSTQHSKGCTKCSYTGNENHKFYYTNNNATTHTKRCVNCSYSGIFSHNINKITQYNSVSHKKSCDCGYYITESHVDSDHDYQCDICKYKLIVAIPVTTSFVYSGSTKTVMDLNVITYTGTASATNVGNYTLNATPVDGYKWSDDTTTSKTITWSITPKPITIKAKARMVEIGSSPSWGVDNVLVEYLAGSDVLSSITVTPSISTASVGYGTITPSNAVITKNNTNVNSNYSITYESAVFIVNNTEINDLELSVIPTTVVDITSAETDNMVPDHDCNNYSYDIFDAEYHYKVCRLCHEAFEKYKAANGSISGFVLPSNGSEIVNDIEGHPIIVLKNSHVAHNLPTSSSDSEHWKWSGGGKNDCATTNHLYKFCTYDCGYSYLVPDTESGKAAHTATVYSSGKTVEHGANYLYWHRNCCSKCGKRNFNNADTNCYKSKSDKNNKIRIKCDNLGKCYLCGYNYTTKIHYVKFSETNKTGRCRYCNALYVNLDENGNSDETIVVSSTGNKKRKITFNATLRYAPISSEGRSLSGSCIWSSAKKYALDNKETFSMTPTINNKIIKLVGTYEYSNYHIEVRNNVDVMFEENLANGAQVTFRYALSGYDLQLRREENEPVFAHVSGDSALTYNGWTTKMNYRIDGTEDYCSKVSLSMNDPSASGDAQIILDGVKLPVNSNAWLYEFSPKIAVGVEGKHFLLKVQDSLENVGIYDLFASKIDSISPVVMTNSEIEEVEPIDIGDASGDVSGDFSGDAQNEPDEEGEEESSGEYGGMPIDDSIDTGYITTTKEWSKSKQVQVLAADEGIQIAEMRLQDIDGVQDNYGVTTLALDNSNIQYIRDYEFVGTVRGHKLISVGSKDPLGNSTSTYVKVYNVDSVAPSFSGDTTISASDGTFNLTIKDEYSGLKYFGIVESLNEELDENSVYPTTYASTLGVTQAVEDNKWFQAPLYVGDSSNEYNVSHGTNVGQYTFYVRDNGRHYIVMEDYVGNRSYQEVMITGIDYNPPKGSISIKETIDIGNDIQAVDTQNVKLIINATDDYGVDKVLVVNENNTGTISSGDWIDWMSASALTGSGDTKEMDWTLSSGSGYKTVYLIVKDVNGNTTAQFGN